MSSIRTHYDNLKVARDAPPEVIKAAYKSLAQRYHPDRNQGDKEAERIMQLINQSYNILSDVDKRAEHDRWIADQEREQQQLSRRHAEHTHSTRTSHQQKEEETFSFFGQKYTKQQNAAPRQQSSFLADSLFSQILRFRPIYSIGILLYVMWSFFGVLRTPASQQSIMPSASVPQNNATYPVEYRTTPDQPTPQIPSFATALSNVIKQASQVSALQGVYVDINRAREMGMNDDVIYWQLIQSKKWRTPLQDLKQQQAITTHWKLAQLLGLQLGQQSVEPQNTPESVASNFFDQLPKSDQSAYTRPDLAEKNGRAMVENMIRAYSGGDEAKRILKRNELHQRFAMNPIPVESIQPKIHILRLKGISDQEIYQKLAENSPFSQKITEARQAQFSDHDIGEIFGLSVQ